MLSTHLRLRSLAVLTVIAALFTGLVMATPSQAAPPVAVAPVAVAADVLPSAFALTCNLNSVAQARVDFPNGFNYTSDHSHVDTNAIRYRSINRTTGTVASWKADAVWIQLWNAHTGKWDLWTGKGGTATDGTYVGPDFTWDPSAKNSIGSDFWNKLRMHTWFNGNSCSSIEVKF